MRWITRSLSILLIMWLAVLPVNITGQTVHDSATVFCGSPVEFFDISLDSASTDTSGSEFVPDFRGSSNEGINFGEEFSGIPGNRILLYSANGSLDTVGTVPKWTNTSPWIATFWESDGTNYQPISVGELWVVYTREGHYAVMQITNIESGDRFYFDYKYQPNGSRNFEVIVSVEDQSQVIREFHLAQNYPNPFNPVTQIQYDIPRETEICISIYDMLGREVKVLVNRKVSSGRYVTEWDGRDAFGDKVSSGIYFYRIDTPDFSDVGKIVLMK